MKRIAECRVCGYESIETWDSFAFQPIFCCEIKKSRKMQRRKKR